MKSLAVAVLLAILANASLAQNKTSTAPDVSGMYSFLQEGEFVQITVEDQGKVTGFVSRYGDAESDRGAFLDQFIKTGALQGQRISFTTEPVHGVWFEFQGTVGRGEGKTPADEGYYAMRGTLTRHETNASRQTSTRARAVVFKSFPQDEMPPSAKRD